MVWFSTIAPITPNPCYRQFINQIIIKMKIHELKLQQPFFDDVFFNRKDFEVRKNDRDFKVGDRLKLIEYPNDNPRFVLMDIKYILQGGQFGIESGYVVLGLKDVPFAQPLSEIIKQDLEDKMTMQIIGRGRV